MPVGRIVLILALILAVVLGGVAGLVVSYYLPPHPLYGAGTDIGGIYWMAGQVNAPGSCGFTFTAFGDSPPDPATTRIFTVLPEFGSGPGTTTSGGMLRQAPTDAPVGSYIVVYGWPISNGYWCSDQRQRYVFVDGVVLRNPAWLPDPALRRLLAWGVATAPVLLVLALRFLIRRLLARRAAALRS